MKYYVIAGEASGDLHGSNLLKELKKLDATANFRCWGGDKMEAQGATIVKHYRELSFMGFAEVVANISTILNQLKFCKQDILQYHPDVIILIDYPGFNLRIAKWAKLKGFKVIFYISPQLWAWKKGRVKIIKKYVDKMLVILPFEKAFYKNLNFDADYVGHPLVKVIEDFKKDYTKNKDTEFEGTDQEDAKPIIALLPGSRAMEIKIKLPVMLQMTTEFPAYRFVIAKAPAIADEFYETILHNYANVGTVSGQTYSLLIQAKAALVTSGTATLETALFNVPQVVCYKGSAVSYQVAKRLVKIKFISLVNLIMNREVVKELIQDEFNAENLKRELHEILTNINRLEQIKKNYADLKNLLSEGGNASENAAKIITAFLAH
ncbi:MAG: lipid-A-disaccharide synthase [Chitinophagaceae bacterium]|nr:lipid-A-disaccharide synthase [Chitinophagaceae bacterium]